MAEIARIIVYSDPHLHSKNYGAHRDYAAESLDCFKKITDAVIENNATHLIGLGDFTYGRFHTLEYREAVELELNRQYSLVNGNHYQLKGNHDSAGYGMTEYEYYIKKGLLRRAENLTIGNTHITMVNYGEHNNTIPNIVNSPDKYNVILAHDFFKFSDTAMPDMGKHIDLDNFELWYGADYLICGHIHNQYAFEGLSLRQEDDGQTHGHRMLVHYPGALSRPTYRAGHMDEVGQLALLIVHDDAELEYKILNVELLPLEESFNLVAKAVEAEKKEEKAKRVDISDIIGRLNQHERNIGNPEDIINGLDGVDERYKARAIELLKLGQG